MDKPSPTDRRVRPYRVALLVALGATSAVAFTAPGHWAAARMVRACCPPVQAHAPLFLMGVTGEASRSTEVWRLCADMQVERDEEAPRVVPTPDEMARRLASVDGWCTAVMYEYAVGVGGLYEAGLGDIELCGRVIGPPLQRGVPSSGQFPSPFQHWRLVLLNDEGRFVATAGVSALRPGWAPSETEPDVWVQSPAAPGDGVLPAVSVFRRLPDGEVIRD